MEACARHENRKWSIICDPTGTAARSRAAGRPAGPHRECAERRGEPPLLPCPLPEDSLGRRDAGVCIAPYCDDARERATACLAASYFHAAWPVGKIMACAKGR